MWQTRCIGHTHVRVQTLDLEQGFGEPAVATSSLEGNERGGFLFQDPSFIFIWKSVYSGQQEEKDKKRLQVKDVEFNPKRKCCGRPETAFGD